MEITQDLKENVFKVLEDQMSLEDFERWIYDSEELQKLTTEDVALDTYTLNYKQRDAKYQFKKAIFKYFDEDEFILWKVKSNLRDLIANRNDRDRILYDFYYLGYDGYTFLQPIGYYMYQIEDIEYYGNNLEAVLVELKRDSEDLLREIETQELEKPGFRLEDYRGSEKIGRPTSGNNKKVVEILEIIFNCAKRLRILLRLLNCHNG